MPDVKSDPYVPVAPVGSLYHNCLSPGGAGNTPEAAVPSFSVSSRQARTQSAKCIFRACVPKLFRATVNDKRQFHRYSLRVNIVIEIQENKLSYTF